MESLWKWDIAVWPFPTLSGSGSPERKWRNIETEMTPQRRLIHGKGVVYRFSQKASYYRSKALVNSNRRVGFQRASPTSALNVGT